MGIGRLYYFTVAFLASTYISLTHYKNFDGSWHRPKNQAKKARKKAEAKAKEEAAAKSEKLVDDLERRARAERHAHRRHRRRDDTPAPRAPHPAAGNRHPRRGSRAYDDGGDRYGDGRYGDERYSDGSSRSSSVYAKSHGYSTNPLSRRHSSHKQFEHRVKPNPYSEYVPEASAHILGTPPPPEPMGPVHSTKRHSSFRKPADFAMPDHTRPGHTTRDGRFEHFTLPSRDRERPTQQAPDEQDVSQLSSPVLHPGGKLHKRRMDVSPEKFNKGHFEPLKVRTDIPLPVNEPPVKRTRTGNAEKKIEIYYDSVGTPKIKETPDSIEAGFTPKTAAFPPNVMNATPLPAPKTADPGKGKGHIHAAMRLLSGLTPEKRAKAMEFVRKQKKFSLLDSFVRDDALCMILVSYLPMPALIDLYAISKWFHYKFNKEATAFILASMRTWAPKADQIFPWRCYKQLCIKDPEKKQKASAVKQRGGPDVEADYNQIAQGSRDVPSLRWLQMVVYRNLICKDMIISLGARGLRVSPAIMDPLQRMWFILDLPLNAHRIALMHSETYMTTEALKIATQFFLKIDMALTDPGHTLEPFNPINPAQHWIAYVGSSLRQLLISETSFTPLWRVLKNWSPIQDVERDEEPHAWPLPLEEADMYELYWRHKGRVPRDIPPESALSHVLGGSLSPQPIAGYERLYSPEDDKTLTPPQISKLITTYGPKELRPPPQRLLTPVDLIMKEAIRRKLKQHEWWVEMMLDGFEEVKGKGKGFPWNERGFYELAGRDFSPAVRGRLERLRREEAEKKRKVEEERVGGGDGDGEVGCDKDGGEKGDERGDEKKVDENKGDEKGDGEFSIDPSDLD
ncbi:hypothetical protein M409DRAFT_51038 [Zasmidium cellare ATCC 36951]|uniref:Uncharacterized protein n=1 Tax=Zasmidium cellare ATCC 36951 TaxID=1080233 RepID=A0A6A6CX27_ZASCE|nr:uncharacterized protein M409DRAFT_51038 [Zasmidium cellare ATCC 36951]KAF2170778.1 hypothetical protein M409DRAFT_51038 [Zasmidium cellare ATCC 36951]